MAEPIRLHRYTFTEYLAIEEVARVKHEYLDGEIYAMAGGTPEHAALSALVTTMLGEQLRGGPCRVYSSDLRVRILATGLATYPDVTVVCGPTERDPESATRVVNPRVVVEVLSDGTEEYDRGEKLEHYKKAPSLMAVVLVSHRERKIEVWTRRESAWDVAVHGSGEVARLSPLDCSLDVDSIYDAASEQTS
ncbi:MAG: Uma2 family endonuclease [Candidatus Binatia bacterium]